VICGIDSTLGGAARDGIRNRPQPRRGSTGSGRSSLVNLPVGDPLAAARTAGPGSASAAGYSSCSFSGTIACALTDATSDYSALSHDLGPWMTLQGGDHCARPRGLRYAVITASERGRSPDHAERRALRLGLSLARRRHCGAGNCGHARRLGWLPACGRGGVPRARRASCSGARTRLGHRRECGRSTRLGDREQHAHSARQLNCIRLLAWLQSATPAATHRRARTVVRVRDSPHSRTHD
jgi:hypothetical protein